MGPDFSDWDENSQNSFHNRYEKDIHDKKGKSYKNKAFKTSQTSQTLSEKKPGRPKKAQTSITKKEKEIVDKPFLLTSKPVVNSIETLFPTALKDTVQPQLPLPQIPEQELNYKIEILKGLCQKNFLIFIHSNTLYLYIFSASQTTKLWCRNKMMLEISCP